MPIQVDKKLEKLTITIQSMLDKNPALLIGSGGSVPYGLPSMKDLANEITEKLNAIYKDDDTWKAFIAELARSDNLELALEKVVVKEEIHNAIVSIIWEIIDKKDREAINSFLKSSTSPALTLILKKFVQHAGVTDVVTTNYDRLIEYSIDSSQGAVQTGFSGNCIKTFCRFNSFSGCRTVNLYKVHGSIDWFRNKKNYEILATNFMTADNLTDT